MNKELLAKKQFTVQTVDGPVNVTVQRLREDGADKPDQVLIECDEIQGIQKMQLSSINAPGNADCEYAEFDWTKAQKFVNGLVLFLNTKKGQKLAADA